METPTSESITCASVAHAPSSVDDPLWDLAKPAVIGHFHSASSGHRPAAECRALYVQGEAVHLRFAVEDRWVVARHTEPNSAVYQESVYTACTLHARCTN